MPKLIFEMPWNRGKETNQDILAVMRVDISKFEEVFIKKFSDFKTESLVQIYNPRTDLANDPSWKEYLEKLSEIVNLWGKSFEGFKAQYSTNPLLNASQEMKKVNLYLQIVNKFKNARPWTPESLTAVFDTTAKEIED